MKTVLNPPGGWAQNEGQDFLNNNRLDCVDIVGLHGAPLPQRLPLGRCSRRLRAVWPDNWGDAAKSPTFQQAYIRSHLADVAANLKKVRSFLLWPGLVWSAGSRTLPPNAFCLPAVHS